MKEKDYKIILKCPDVSQSFLNKVLKAGTITGSQVFGGVIKFSDTDILLLRNDQDFNLQRAIDNGCICLFDYVMDEYISVYAKTANHKIYNILIIHDKDVYLQWVNATILLRNMLKNNKQLRPLMKDKTNRVKMFETLKEIIKRR